MTVEQALSFIEQATASIQANRVVHQQIVQALEVLKAALKTQK